MSAVLFERPSPAEARTLGGVAQCWWAVAYTGAISIAAGYTLQAVGQRHAPPADAAVLLSMEAVFAALSGMLLLSEAMSGRQYAGCAVILAAVMFVQIKPATSAGAMPMPAEPGTLP
jgi:drug/metabolite transporter (DMT)-like permease